ncbi:RNA-directed DNA polymerase [Pseudonocardia sediminis]|uniref:RNA-directed DNA polymerase n=1 Tax=Pseudonocardia sediminis TaxID=1397368 RepID=A0A4Q7UWA8_PSEST|nr:reverse transcriptase family protein [Pseudonocardia sediminis]RZT86287.1 RNA-directed DNA polymerase [Pseudonocardia sediminis]
MTEEAEGVLRDVLGVRWEVAPLAAALADRIGERAAGAAERLVERWPQAPRGTHADLVEEIAVLLAVRRRLVPAEPQPSWRWGVAEWESVDALSRGLDLRDGETEWFADPGGWLRRAPEGPLHHYRGTWRVSPSGAPRLLETPAPRIAELQRRIGRRVLMRIPVHPAAHGYVRGRSPATFAAVHAGAAMVLRVDVEGFFSRIGPARIAGLLRTAGYPAAVAAVLAGMLVTSTPRAVLRRAPGAPGEARRRLIDRLALPHLPQGAPTSPAVANVLAHGLDRRLDGLAGAVGARYARYADDLVFSGEADLPVHGLLRRAGEIAADEGFDVRPDKTRVMPAHHRQRVTGLVVNAGPAVSRRDYDDLRALLHNCARTGPDAQNTAGHPAFREYLLGRIAWAGTGRPARRDRLAALFARIDFGQDRS